MKNPVRAVRIVGFGSQATAWAEILRASGWDVSVYLSREGASFARAKAAGFNPKLLAELARDLQADFEHRAPGSPKRAPALIAMLCPDDQIAPVYADCLANVDGPLSLVLAHGYAVYADELKPSNPDHRPALLAPKAIGPKLMMAGLEARKQQSPHGLKAGFFAADEAHRAALESMALAMGFAPMNLIPASFEKEAIGDLISEQGLLCGGVFTLLEWTMEAMAEAGVPDALIREECLTELELIAGLLRELGPASTFGKISQAAQCGAIAMRDRLLSSGAKKAFEDQVGEVVSKSFVDTMRSPEWKAKADAFRQRLQRWEDRLNS